jgi:hypothetical protein
MQKLYFRALFPNKNLAFKKKQSFAPLLNRIFSQSFNSFSTTVMQPKYIPKYYADVNSKMPPEYSDYENYENAWG